MPSPSQLDWTQWLGNLTLTESWRAQALGSRQLMQLPVAWTLCFEEQFYLIVGVILALAPRRLFVALAAVTFLVFMNSVSMNIAPVRMMGWNLNALQLRWHGTFAKRKFQNRLRMVYRQAK